MDYIDNFVMAYLDDILIYLEDLNTYVDHVKKVLSRLIEAGLYIDVKKSEFHVTRTKYLGYILTITRVEVDPKKVEPLKNWKPPTTVTGVKSYLGFYGFYRQFIRRFGEISKPLTNLTRPMVPFYFNQECLDAFKALYKELLYIPRIYYFDLDLPTKLETDALDRIIAGIYS